MIVPVLAIALGEADLETAVSRLIPTLEPVLRTRLLEALTEIAGEFKDQLPGARIENAATNEGISLNSWLLKASERGSLAVTIGRRQIKGKGRS